MSRSRNAISSSGSLCCSCAGSLVYSYNEFCHDLVSRRKKMKSDWVTVWMRRSGLLRRVLSKTGVGQSIGNWWHFRMQNGTSAIITETEKEKTWVLLAVKGLRGTASGSFMLFRPVCFFSDKMSYKVAFGIAKGYWYFYVKQQGNSNIS